MVSRLARGRWPQLAPANRPCDADEPKKQGKRRAVAPRASRPQSLASGGTFRSINNMKFKHILGLLSAAAMSVALAGAASAQDKTVKIGPIYPLSGNAASAGLHGKAAIHTPIDSLNHPHPP